MSVFNSSLLPTKDNLSAYRIEEIPCLDCESAKVEFDGVTCFSPALLVLLEQAIFKRAFLQENDKNVNSRSLEITSRGFRRI